MALTLPLMALRRKAGGQDLSFYCPLPLPAKIALGVGSGQGGDSEGQQGFGLLRGGAGREARQGGPSGEPVRLGSQWGRGGARQGAGPGEVWRVSGLRQLSALGREEGGG